MASGSISGPRVMGPRTGREPDTPSTFGRAAVSKVADLRGAGFPVRFSAGVRIPVSCATRATLGPTHRKGRRISPLQSRDSIPVLLRLVQLC